MTALSRRPEGNPMFDHDGDDGAEFFRIRNRLIAIAKERIRVMNELAQEEFKLEEEALSMIGVETGDLLYDRYPNEGNVIGKIIEAKLVFDTNPFMNRSNTFQPTARVEYAPITREGFHKTARKIKYISATEFCEDDYK